MSRILIAAAMGASLALAAPAAHAALARKLGITPTTKVTSRVTNIKSASLKKQIVTVDPLSVIDGEFIVTFDNSLVQFNGNYAAVGSYNVTVGPQNDPLVGNEAYIQVIFDTLTPPGGAADIVQLEFDVLPTVPDNTPITYDTPVVYDFNDGNGTVPAMSLTVVGTDDTGADVGTLSSAQGEIILDSAPVTSPWRASVFGLQSVPTYGTNLPREIALADGGNGELISNALDLSDLTSGQAGAVSLANLVNGTESLAFLLDLEGASDYSGLIDELNALNGVTAIPAPIAPTGIAELSPFALPAGADPTWDIAVTLDLTGGIPASPYLNWQFDPDTNTPIDLVALQAIRPSDLIPEPSSGLVIGAVSAMLARRRVLRCA